MCSIIPLRDRYGETVDSPAAAPRARSLGRAFSASSDDRERGRYGSPDSSLLDTAPASNVLGKSRGSAIPLNRNAGIDLLAHHLVSSLASLTGSLFLLTVTVGPTTDLEEWMLYPSLLIPAVSRNGRKHAHGLLLARDRVDAEEAISLCAFMVPRGACDLSPVRGWSVRETTPTKLRTNLFQILSYATNEQRQGPIDFGGAVAFGACRAPWERFLGSGAPSFWPTAVSRPCLACGSLVTGRRHHCDRACRQSAYRARKAGRHRPPRDASLASDAAVTPDVSSTHRGSHPPVTPPRHDVATVGDFLDGTTGSGAATQSTNERTTP